MSGTSHSAIHPQAAIGHVHLRVADLDRALSFYHGVELYWDKPRDEWPKEAAGGLAMFTRPLDLRALLAEAAP